MDTEEAKQRGLEEDKDHRCLEKLWWAAAQEPGHRVIHKPTSTSLIMTTKDFKQLLSNSQLLSTLELREEAFLSEAHQRVQLSHKTKQNKNKTPTTEGQNMCTFNVTWIESRLVDISPFPKYKTLNLPSIHSFIPEVGENVPSKFLAPLPTKKWGLCPCPLNLGWFWDCCGPERTGECRGWSWRAMPLLSPLQEHVHMGPWAPGTVADSPEGHQAIRKQSHIDTSHGAILVTRHVSEMSSSPSIRPPPAFQVSTAGAQPTCPSCALDDFWPTASPMTLRRWWFSAAKFLGNLVHKLTSVGSRTIFLLHFHLRCLSVEPPILKQVISTCFSPKTLCSNEN